jgi:hypothetical protein
MLIVRGLLAALFFQFAIVDCLSQDSLRQAPQVKSEQQPESGLQPQERDKKQTETTPEFPLRVPEVLSDSSEEESQGDTNKGSEQGTEFWAPFYGYRLKVTDTLLVAFTFLLFNATIALWWSTRRLVRGAEKTAERQLRAYVGILSGHLAVEIIDGIMVPKATLRIRNFGQTPAYDVSCNAGIENASNFSKTRRKLNPVSGKSIIFPQSDQRAMFSGEFNEPPGQGKISTFIFGCITYKDAFRQRRRTNFRFTGHYTPGNTRADLTPCDDGNEAD